MSSPPSSASSEADDVTLSKSKSNSPDRPIAFLVHSPDSVANNLPPDCDNKPLARQRRRRTSPDDQKILEEAFARNPRPNKEERREIISQVALGDKEVQIWFQNRRQSSRRKPKPTVSQELGASPELKSSSPFLSPVENPTSTTMHEQQVPSLARAAFEASELLDETEPHRADGLEAAEKGSNREEKSNDPVLVGANREGPLVDGQDDAAESQSTVAIADASQDPLPSTFPTEPNSYQNIPSSQEALFSSLTKPTYLANRRSASFVRQASQEGLPVAQVGAPPTAGGTPGMRNSGSFLRLSMTEDGQATVIDRSVPSPPRSQPAAVSPTEEQPPSGSLRRSYSAAGLNDLFKQSSPENASRTKVARLSQVGRSRDSRAWEFWCDSESRNSLVTKADQENSGSAADAIGLMRQNSKNALRPNSRIANSPMVSQASFSGLSSAKQPRPKLQRASTTHGRLQQPKDRTGKHGEEFERSPGSDSDKENWDPEDSMAHPRRRPQGNALNPRRGRKILGENAHLPSYQTSLGGLMDSEKRRRAAPAAVDDEVAAFMDAANESEDLDCVQSLLSLSKGNWR